MAASNEAPLDESVFSDLYQLYNVMHGLHTNSVLHYFARSPYFDQTSNNAVLYTQSVMNPKLQVVLETREAMEARLRTMAGLEFIVAQEPAETAPGTGTGVWVIRKQTRKKRHGEEDEIAVLNTYFVVEGNVYMAPALSDILASRMLSILSPLNKFVTSAAALPDFSPALGHTYMPPTATKSKTHESHLGGVSKENTPLPESIQNPKKALPSTNNSTALNSRLLEETLNISMKYGDEYMDDFPITGHPGSFNLATTGRREKDKLMVRTASRGPLQAPAKPTPPPTLKTDVPPARKDSKATKSPKTPGMPKPKRRKSKAQMSGGASPT